MRDGVGGIGQCGACTVHIDSVPIRACLPPVSSVKKNRITTIEGLTPNAGHPLRQAWQFLGLLGPSYRKGRLLQSLGSTKQLLEWGAPFAIDALHYVQRIL
jgi:isoquinoline 1-oxidoreductase alpha subunit